MFDTVPTCETQNYLQLEQRYLQLEHGIRYDCLVISIATRAQNEVAMSVPS
jgi:hypothetical protein